MNDTAARVHALKDRAKHLRALISTMRSGQLVIAGSDRPLYTVLTKMAEHGIHVAPKNDTSTTDGLTIHVVNKADGTSHSLVAARKDIATIVKAFNGYGSRIYKRPTKFRILRKICVDRISAVDVDSYRGHARAVCIV